MLKKIKELEGINPLNGYRLDCYRQAFLPCIRYFNRDIRPFLLANIGQFEYNRTLTFSEIPLLDYNLALQHLGIERQYLLTTKTNLIKDICKSINDEKIVIMYVDTYSYKKFPALYSKVHSRHCVLIYGYNLDNRFFDIIDTNFVESFERKKTKISFDDISIAHNEMVENYGGSEFIEIVTSLKNYDKKYGDIYISHYISFIKNNSHIFQNSIKSLQNFALYLDRIFYEKEKIQDVVASIYISFNKAINLRHLEYVAYSNIFSNIDGVLQCLDELIDLYNYVRAVMYKSLYAKQYREESFRKCLNIINDIIELEIKLIKLQYEYISTQNIVWR